MSYYIQRKDDKRVLHLDTQQRIMQNWTVEIHNPELFATRTEAKAWLRRERPRDKLSDFSFRIY